MHASGKILSVRKAPQSAPKQTLAPRTESGYQSSYSGGQSRMGMTAKVYNPPLLENQVVVDNNLQAVWHYYNGHGATVRIGMNTVKSLLNSPKFITYHKNNLSSPSKLSGNFPINMTERVFHVGRTNVTYNINTQKKNIVYHLFVGDGFWDPDFIDERVMYNKLHDSRFKPDGKGPNLERFGEPYKYETAIVSFQF